MILTFVRFSRVFFWYVFFVVVVVFEILLILEYENRSRICSTVSADAVSVCSFTSQGRILHISNETKNLLSAWKSCLIGCGALGSHF